MKVMLVDDEEWCLEELAEILSKVEGIEITGTYSVAAEAVKAVAREAPDVVFIDVQMPVMSGLDLAVHLKKQRESICIILMSEKECFARNGFDIGVNDYVLKPIKKDRVIRALMKADRPL